ncbi:hypothetical protein ACVIGB_000893 [Bradyrhizobium sp. USDA 4341]
MSKSPSKAELAMTRAIEVLLEGGFVPDGETASATVRSESSTSLVLGGAGGRLTKVGGRARFSLPGTDWRATVGKMTTTFYRVVDGTTFDMNAFSTSEDDRLGRAVAAASAQTHASSEEDHSDAASLRACRGT